MDTLGYYFDYLFLKSKNRSCSSYKEESFSAGISFSSASRMERRYR